MMKTRVLEFDRAMRRRDVREAAVVAACLPTFLWSLWTAPSLLSRAGTTITMLSIVFIPLWLWWERRPAASPDQPVAAMVAHELGRVRAQIHLLRSLIGWYMVAPAIGFVLFTAGLGMSLAGRITFGAGFGAFLVLAIRRGHRRVVDRLLLPRQRELEALQAAIAAGDVER